MKHIIAVGLVVGLAACTAPIPDSGAGVGFEDYNTYLAQQRARDEALRTGQVVTVQPPASSDATPAVVTTPEQQTAQAAVAAIGGAPEPAAAVQVSTDNPDLSDEQDFQAVSSRQSIESDAQRRQAQSAQYQVIAPTALPTRPRRGGSQTPIEFAVATSHPIGTKVYRRSPFGARKSAAACAKYTSGEAAQQAFLEAGGPNRDRLGLDPDGDGYACRWNPDLYRVNRSN